ncbi:MAG: SpoIIE family protein phosphatase [Gemmataceae bacterium]|nr:SpoIIE family protein phosphatase [Gemmataceae bacterium]
MNDPHDTRPPAGRFAAANARVPGRTRRDAAKAFRSYVQAVPVGVLFLNEPGRITFANESALSRFGYTLQEVLGRPIEVLIPGWVRPQHADLRVNYTTHLDDGITAGRPLTGLRKDGSAISFAIKVNSLQGSESRIACTILELPASPSSEQDMGRFFDLSLDLFCIANFHGYFIRVNPNFSRVLGFPETELLVRPFTDFVHPDDLEATRSVMGQLLESKPVVRFRNRYWTASGAFVWFEWSARAVLEEGTIYATARDVTEQVGLEQEVATRQKRERALLDNTPANVYVRNRDGRYEYVNQRHADLFQMTAANVIGQRPQDVFAGQSADQLLTDDQSVMQTGKTLILEELISQPDGVHTFVSTKFALFDANHEVAAIAGISTDITEQIRAKETEQQLQMAREFQNKLYPPFAPQVKGLDAAGSAVPVAQLCGDYYDFIVAGPGKLLVAMGDVSGHGIGPALEMVAVRTAMRMLLRGEYDLSGAVEELNRMLVGDLPESSFVSLFVAELNAETRCIRYIGAGHEAWLQGPPGLRRLNATGPLLGIDGAAEYAVATITNVQVGDIFLLYTDGVTEAMNTAGEQYTSRRLLEVVKANETRPAKEIVAKVFSGVYQFTEGRPIADDMTIVAARFEGLEKR